MWKKPRLETEVEVREVETIDINLFRFDPFFKEGKRQARKETGGVNNRPKGSGRMRIGLGVTEDVKRASPFHFLVSPISSFWSFLL